MSTSQALRERVMTFMKEVAIPARSPATDPPSLRADGVLEFAKQWRVGGRAGLFASVSDYDDVIEFGVLERAGGDMVHILHASLALEEQDGRLAVISEARADLNFDAIVRAGHTEFLDRALRFFVESLRSAGNGSGRPESPAARHAHHAH